MKFNLFAYRPLRTGLVVVLGLLIAGVALRPIEGPAWETVRGNQPALRLESLTDALGQGVTVGLLGGFRAMVANFFWIRTYTVWGDYDLPKTQTTIKIVTAIDPRPLYFWQNGSRIIAYDMPNWRIDKAGGYDAVPEHVQRRFDEEQSKIAIEYLQSGLEFHPENPILVLEIGNIYLNRLKDYETAAKYYLRASKHPDAPYYTLRIYAELLRRLGRKEEAYVFLKELYPTLPKDEVTAQAPIVLERIRAMEDELSIPDALRYHE